MGMKKTNKRHVWRSWAHTANIALLGNWWLHVGFCGKRGTYVAIFLLYVRISENGFQLAPWHKQGNKA